MNYTEKWIWLPEKEYSDVCNTRINCFSDSNEAGYAVAEFKRSYSFDKNIKSAELRFSGDIYFELYLSDSIIATGPAYSGGDFLGNEEVRNDYYAMKAIVYPEGNTLDFFVRVRSMPVVICEYSRGRGGFMLAAEITFDDGTRTVVTTDKSWQVSLNRSFVKPYKYDSRLNPDDYVQAEEIENIWNCTDAPIPVREETEIFPQGKNCVTVAGGIEQETVFELDKIYAGFVKLSVKTEGVTEIELFCVEKDESGSVESFVFDKASEYRGMFLQSAGRLLLKIKNKSQKPAEITVSFIATNYPVAAECKAWTSDSELNKVLDVCRHTLKYCRQLHHLDSPRHCEPLACTGDYYIESLMTAFSFGDMRLAEFDVLRTAMLIRDNNGRMFHTTYSLIWVRMLWDIYMITGNKELLVECEDALRLLLKLFEGYIGENGLIETPPDYMFIDWVYVDGLSMHHPPKALGQACLNIFYFGALDFAGKIFSELSCSDMAAECRTKKEKIRNSVNTLLFDSERGVYFEGLNTPTPDDMLYEYMPQNTDKRYYLKHSNVLAAYFGVCDDDIARELIHKVMSEELDGKCQPYFMHYLFEAVFRLGLREEYTLKLLEMWKPHIKECDKGLVEGFYKPEPTYSFDHSHAWGGTPLWSLPRALIGLEILKPGMKEIKISPSLMGLESAYVELPTPYGTAVFELNKNSSFNIKAPEEIEYNSSF